MVAAGLGLPDRARPQRLRVDDRAAVEAQLERPLRAQSPVMSRCHLDIPVVIAVPPVLDDGTPFPTRYWLTCPLARKRISRLESAGGIRAIERFAEGDEAFSTRLAAADARYAAERDALIPLDADHRPSGGVGGVEGSGLKCLHAHYADGRAGNENPVASVVEPFVEPLDCTVGCVESHDGQVVRNPDWLEPV